MKIATELIILEKHPQVIGKSRLNLLAEEIQKFLYKIIHSEEGISYIEVEGHKNLFELYDNKDELGLHGGQISIFSYTSRKKNEGIFSGINCNGLEKQADHLWKMIDVDEGYAQIHFVYYEGLGLKGILARGSQTIYNGPEMTAYRIRFRLQRKDKSKMVLLYDLNIVKEKWNKYEIKTIV